MRPNPENLQRARRLYDLARVNDLAAEYVADLAMRAARGMSTIPAMVKDQVREERAARQWREHRRGGWSPSEIVLRSTLHETETWFDPRGSREDYGFGPSFAARVDAL